MSINFNSITPDDAVKILDSEDINLEDLISSAEVLRKNTRIIV